MQNEVGDENDVNPERSAELEKADKDALRQRLEQLAIQTELQDFVFNPHLTRRRYDNTYASLLYKVKRSQVEMVRDRGYDVGEDEQWFIDPEHPDYGLSVNKFVDEYRGNDKTFTIKTRFNNVYVKPNGTTHLHVFYPEDESETKKTSKNQLKEVFDLIKSTETLNLCIITQYPLSSDLKSKLTKEKLPTSHFEFFLYEELAFNPTLTIWNPKFELVTDDETKRRVSQQQNLLKFVTTEKGDVKAAENLYLLPSMSEQDPMARYYGAKSGDLMRIYRTNFMFDSMVREYTVYRYVRNTPLEVVRK